MKFGINVPIYGPYADPHLLVSLAVEAEAAGWDGVFIWDHIAWGAADTPDQTEPLGDVWIVLAALAQATRRVKLGPMVTPLPRRRPWKVARETVTLDHLSQGRLILGVGLGGWQAEEFEAFGDAGDLTVRAAQLDEGLQVLAGLWCGEPFRFAGKHYQVKAAHFMPRPYQSPRIPVWVAGTWSGKRAPFRRAARWDGVIPMVPRYDAIRPDEVQAMVEYIASHRADMTGYDVAVWNRSEGDGGEEETRLLRAYADAGATWWHEDLSLWRFGPSEARERIRRGPPRF